MHKHAGPGMKERCLNPRRSKHHSDTPSGPYHLWNKRPFLPMQKHASSGNRLRKVHQPARVNHHKLFYGHRDSAANLESQTLHAKCHPSAVPCKEKKLTLSKADARQANSD